MFYDISIIQSKYYLFFVVPIYYNAKEIYVLSDKFKIIYKIYLYNMFFIDSMINVIYMIMCNFKNIRYCFIVNGIGSNTSCNISLAVLYVISIFKNIFLYEINVLDFVFIYKKMLYFDFYDIRGYLKRYYKINNLYTGNCTNILKLSIYDFICYINKYFDIKFSNEM